MSDMNKINDESLENVVGGKLRRIYNDSASYANIRGAAGLHSKVLFKMNNGEMVDTTGNHINRDNIEWYEIYLDDNKYGWIAGHFIGL